MRWERDPVRSLASNGHHMESDSLMRLADNIFYAVSEEQPKGNWSEVESRALTKFLKEVPNMEAEAKRKIIKAVSPHFQSKFWGVAWHRCRRALESRITDHRCGFPSPHGLSSAGFFGVVARVLAPPA